MIAIHDDTPIDQRRRRENTMKRLVKTVYGVWAEEITRELNIKAAYGTYTYERMYHPILGDIARIYCNY